MIISQYSHMVSAKFHASSVGTHNLRCWRLLVARSRERNGAEAPDCWRFWSRGAARGMGRKRLIAGGFGGAKPRENGAEAAEKPPAGKLGIFE